jgi:hypothetical protein
MKSAYSWAVAPLAVLTFLLAALESSTARAAYVPIPLTPGTFNQDMVVEATAVNDPTAHYGSAVTASMDGGTTKSGNTWYQIGLNTAAPTTGLPGPGVVTSAADATAGFLLQPYNANNATLLDAASRTATLTALTPAKYSALSLLTSSGNGSGTLSLTLQFADGGADITVPGTVPSPDWFNGTPIAINANGRVVATTGVFANVASGNPRLYQENITLPAEAAGRDLSAVIINWTGSGTTTHTAIFALSGTPVPEPAAIALLGMGALAVLTRRPRKGV